MDIKFRATREGQQQTGFCLLKCYLGHLASKIADIQSVLLSTWLSGQRTTVSQLAWASVAHHKLCWCNSPSSSLLHRTLVFPLFRIAVFYWLRDWQPMCQYYWHKGMYVCTIGTIPLRAVCQPSTILYSVTIKQHGISHVSSAHARIIRIRGQNHNFALWAVRALDFFTRSYERKCVFFIEIELIWGKFCTD